MSSWPTAVHAPSSHRSTSRSPSRAPYPPRPETAYPQDAYRADWEAYDRDRAWANYERERAAYEYSRRGRSRSPGGVDDVGRKRRRSMSPYDRDRYDPRPRYPDDYDAHSRGYGYTSPRRGQYSSSYSSSRRAPPDPHTFDYSASLKQYAEWFRYYYPQQAIEEDNADKAAEQDAGDGSKPRNGIKSRWEKYKKDFAATQLQTMFDHHRKSPWFAEKYDPAPEFQQLRKKVRKEGWRGRLDTFLLDLETGKFDPDLNEPESDASPIKENVVNGVATTTETNGNGAAAPAEESKVNPADDDAPFSMDVEEDHGENDANRGDANGKSSYMNKQGNNRGEEVSVPPEGNQVMIRTIPPDIGRVKLEDACSKVPGYMYLALGDPLQKRNYYRAGWLRFRDDADMTAVMAELSEKKIEGFKLHVTHNMRPFVNRIRYAPEVASKPDRIAKDLSNIKALAALLEEEAATLRKFKPQVLTTEPPIEADDAKVKEEIKEEPMEGIERPAEDDDPEPSERGSDAVERRVEKVMTDLREQGLVNIQDEVAYENRKNLVSLDLYLAYLRAAFHTCYYCAIVTDHLEELQRKCLKHVRKPLSKMLLDEIKAAEAEKAEREKIKTEDDKEKVVKEKPTENRDWKRNDERWLEWLDSKAALLVNRDGVDPREYGGKCYDDELTKAVEPYMKQEDDSKFRCKTCSKLFKATSFVEKHIANKHSELVKHLDDIPYYNNFALDPHRIQPFAHAPPPVGNSQAPPPQAYGLQGPPAHHGPGDYGRSNSYYGPQGPGYPPHYPNSNNPQWDHYAYQPGAAGGFPPMAIPRRDEAMTARRLSDRLGGFASGFDQDSLNIPVAAGLPPKPAAILEPGPGGRRSRGSGGISGPLPPPPPDAKEDPRAAAGRKVSYHDMDLVAEGDVELTY